MKKSAFILPLAISAMALVACSKHDDSHAGPKAEISVSTDSLNGGLGFKDGNLLLHANGHPELAISADGGILIGDKPLHLNEAQHKLAMDYRLRIHELANRGIDLGKQGASVGIDAAGEALKGLLNGTPEEIGKHVEAQVDELKKQALTLCDALPALKQAQDKLAAAVPEFAPYANMDASDIEDCRKDIEED